MTHDERTRLLEIMSALVAEHAAMRTLLDRQRTALSKAEASSIETIRAEQIGHLERARALEAERRRVVRSITGREDARIEHVRVAFEGQRLEQLESLAEALRTGLDAIRKEQEIVRETATRLIGHMQGMVRQLHQTLSHSGTYGRAGRVDAGPAVVSGIDLTS